MSIKVTVNTPLGSVTYEDVPDTSNSVRSVDGVLTVVYIDDEKMTKEIWFGPGFWHNTVIEEEKY